MDKIITEAGIEYKLPTITLLQESGLGTSEYAARTCYNSFDLSENQSIKNIKHCIENDFIEQDEKDDLNSIESSELLDKLSWVHFHGSVIEHCSLTFAISGTSRGCLAEHSRHRIQSLSVQSTRYTMGQIINAFLASNSYDDFRDTMQDIDYLVLNQKSMIDLENRSIYDKLSAQEILLGKEAFIETYTSKDMRENGSLTLDTHTERFEALQLSKQKRNVGDPAKFIVTDNWKVDMVVTMNLRALKNYLDLRTSGAAYFLMRELASAVKNATPDKYLALIDKEYRNGKQTNTSNAKG